MSKNEVTTYVPEKSAGTSKSHHTLFDETFKTICTYMLPLIIPLINELFGTNYEMSKEEMDRFATEHMKLAESEDTAPKITKVISDAYISLNGIMYHIECQSTEDGDILIRILDYNMRIAFENVETEPGSGNLRVQLPHSMLLMLRKTKADEPQKTEMFINYVYESQKIQVPVQVMHCQAYSMEEIFEKKMYFLIPFYAIRYENDLKRISEDIENSLEKQAEYDKIYSELKKFTQHIYEACGRNELSEHYIRELGTLYRKIVNLLAEKLTDDRRERLVNTMDGQVLELACQKYYREGREEGHQEGLQEGRAENREAREREKQRADAAEAEVKELKALLKQYNIPLPG